MASFIGSLHAKEKSQIFLMVLSTKKDRFWCSHATGASLGKTNADEVLSSKAKKQKKSSSFLASFSENLTSRKIESP